MTAQTIGNYRILRPLGAGGMGEVYLAVDLLLEREVALKYLHPFVTQDAARLARFRSEAVTLARLNHPNIAILHNFFEQNGDYYMVMEYVDGETFESLLRRDGALPLRRVLELFCQSLHGFEHAHSRHVIHRDIKPGNLMLNGSGTVKIMDFGIARVAGSQHLTQAGKHVGTLEYMSPEQVQGLEQDVRSDIYSLGILLYEMLTGRVPFSSTSDYEVMRSHLEVAPPSVREIVRELPPELERVLKKMLAKQPADRFQSVTELRALLEPLLARLTHEAATPKAPANRGRTTRPADNLAHNLTRPTPAALVSRLRFGPATVAAGGTALLATGLIVVALRSRPATPTNVAAQPTAPLVTQPTAPPSTPVPATAVPIVLPPTPKPAARPVNLNKAQAEMEAQQAKRLVEKAIEDFLLLRKRDKEGLLTEAEANREKAKLQAQWNDSLRHSERALQLDRANSTAWVQKASALYMLSRHAEAGTVVGQALKQFPKNHDLLDLQTKIKQKLGAANG